MKRPSGQQESKQERVANVPRLSGGKLGAKAHANRGGQHRQWLQGLQALEDPTGMWGHDLVALQPV